MMRPIIGISKEIQRVRELVDHVADTDLNIMINGESGVGKEVVTQNLYYKSDRRNKPFVKVNCAALPEGLLESELFGHEQGSFTGAQRRKRGKFELANHGVLMLDEIGDMSLPLQAKLLHVLQSGEFSRVGSERDIKSDAWIIAATNQDLEEACQKGAFREDLYYRLNIIKIFIPPLRNRPEDIRPLVEYFMEDYTKRFKNGQPLQIDEDIWRELESYPWPGNVRELQNVLKRMVVLGDTDEIVAELRAKAKGASKQTADISTNGHQANPLDGILDFNGKGPDLESLSLKKIRKMAIDQVEQQVIAYVLGQTGWNRSKATKILGISYKTLLSKISELDIKPPTSHHRP